MTASPFVPPSYIYSPQHRDRHVLRGSSTWQSYESPTTSDKIGFATHFWHFQVPNFKLKSKRVALNPLDRPPSPVSRLPIKGKRKKSVGLGQDMPHTPPLRRTLDINVRDVLHVRCALNTSLFDDYISVTCLIQHLAQPLHLIQQHIPLLDHRLVLRRLQGRAGRLDDPVHFVDARVEPAGGDEFGEFAGLEHKDRKWERG
ncbi:hypothetical protein CVT26_007388 [Gymnopilus dilepis]|uniref:Uncharacterized protein n=1 Tax=Gymnopilus dilepis TaxID=231916 RepID=A0A409XA03_9AGAR|nr:hypothetical protein CVT26_007388 [Gymnopilus dilepis]